jgi:hypothetical protein
MISNYGTGSVVKSSPIRKNSGDHKITMHTATFDEDENVEDSDNHEELKVESPSNSKFY